MTAPASRRCSYCLMPVEMGEGEHAELHDFPYAATHYGRCKGSGEPTLAGPGTPPAAWAAGVGSSYLELGVIPSPVPEVVRSGWTVTITNVRFATSYQCWKCHGAVCVATDDNTMEIGFTAQGRSFEKLRAGAPAVFNGPCPYGCGNELALGAGRSTPSSARPVADGWTVMCREWELLRSDLGVTTVHMTRADLARLAAPAAAR
ncbi:hypothetical protein [Streptomyces sp. NBC_01601]|uniref:hypothetical protein n=1 Tax=Streptomyces sp. NBC_01601 TaxID=2975892 RepID=UPI002E2E0BE9|nr:hypothetical protein [Streptomyces sp. NBC_01601]